MPTVGIKVNGIVRQAVRLLQAPLLSGKHV